MRAADLFSISTYETAQDIFTKWPTTAHTLFQPDPIYRHRDIAASALIFQICHRTLAHPRAGSEREEEGERADDEAGKWMWWKSEKIQQRYASLNNCSAVVVVEENVKNRLKRKDKN